MYLLTDLNQLVIMTDQPEQHYGSTSQKKRYFFALRPLRPNRLTNRIIPALARMLPDRVANIVESFSYVKGEGIRIGLAICRLILEAHGGRIWHEPNPSGIAILGFTLNLSMDKQ